MSIIPYIQFTSLKCIARHLSASRPQDICCQVAIRVSEISNHLKCGSVEAKMAWDPITAHCHSLSLFESMLYSPNESSLVLRAICMCKMAGISVSSANRVGSGGVKVEGFDIQMSLANRHQDGNIKTGRADSFCDELDILDRCLACHASWLPFPSSWQTECAWLQAPCPPAV